jgi:hypothetical protein
VRYAGGDKARLPIELMVWRYRQTMSQAIEGQPQTSAASSPL